MRLPWDRARIFLFATGVAACATRGVADTPLDEIVLSDVVEERIEADERLRKAGIRAKTEDGVVMLAGRVSTVQEALLAERIAKRTPGVLDVINAIEIGEGDEEYPIDAPTSTQIEDSTESMMDPQR